MLGSLTTALAMAAMAKDSLDVNYMNVKPGGKQRKMHDTMYQGKVYSMNFPDGTPKGLKRVLYERGVDTTGMKGEMKQILSQHYDFKNEKCHVECVLIEKGHIPIFCPNSIVNSIRIWAQLKRYTRAHCIYTIGTLRKNIPRSYNTVTVENIRRHFNKVKLYMFAYLEGIKPGQELEKKVKKYKKEIKSHRRVSLNE